MKPNAYPAIIGLDSYPMGCTTNDISDPEPDRTEQEQDEADRINDIENSDL